MDGNIPLHRLGQSTEKPRTIARDPRVKRAAAKMAVSAICGSEFSPFEESTRRRASSRPAKLTSAALRNVKPISAQKTPMHWHKAGSHAVVLERLPSQSATRLAPTRAIPKALSKLDAKIMQATRE